LGFSRTEEATADWNTIFQPGVSARRCKGALDPFLGVNSVNSGALEM
jgi:hypothetical protein